MNEEDLVLQLDEIKTMLRKDPSAIERFGSSITDLSHRIRDKVGGGKLVPGGSAAYCHSHCGSHCVSHGSDRLGLLSRVKR